jgi:SH3 domain-containing YSC84-like protein 1
MTEMKRFVIAMCISTLALPLFGQGDQKLDGRLDAARNVINEIMATPDKQIPDSILRDATCVGVVPGMIKGAFILVRSTARVW